LSGSNSGLVAGLATVCEEALSSPAMKLAITLERGCVKNGVLVFHFNHVGQFFE
jgi:hypothetical protein